MQATIPTINLPSDLLSAIDSRSGRLEFKDPATARRFLLIEQDDELDESEITVSDEYIHARLDEARAAFDRGELMEESLDELLAQQLEKLKRGR